jgi:voltage-gated potassium channel
MTAPVNRGTPGGMRDILRRRASSRNLLLLRRFLIAFLVIVAVSTLLFRFCMELEGQHHSLLTGVYWTISTMTTLGLGDITFTGPAGRILTVTVVLSGIFYFLIFIPFMLIRFFQSVERAPRDLPPGTRGHIVMIDADVVTKALIRKLDQFAYPYVIIMEDVGRGLQLHDEGYHVLIGDLDSIDTYRRARVDSARLVALTGSDEVNTSMSLKIREVHPDVPIVATARAHTAADILSHAGASRVLPLSVLLGHSLSRRTLGGDAMTHVIGHFDTLLIAEATVSGTPLVNKTLRESNLRNMTGLTLLGTWERGVYRGADADRVLTDNTVLVLAGSGAQLRTYDELFCIYHMSDAPVIVIGAGSVGRATVEDLRERGMAYRLVDLNPRGDVPEESFIRGDATDPAVLTRAGIHETPSVILTTHDDPTNIYLSILCRSIRPDLKIVSRATMESSVQTLYQAGADFVMSYASMGANYMLNLLRGGNILMIAEGLDVFRIAIPESLKGETIAEAGILEKTGCIIVAFDRDGSMEINPAPDAPIPASGEIILIGNAAAEARFLKIFPPGA